MAVRRALACALLLALCVATGSAPLRQGEILSVTKRSVVGTPIRSEAKEERHTPPRIPCGSDPCYEVPPSPCDETCESNCPKPCPPPKPKKKKKKKKKKPSPEPVPKPPEVHVRPPYRILGMPPWLFALLLTGLLLGSLLCCCLKALHIIVLHRKKDNIIVQPCPPGPIINKVEPKVKVPTIKVPTIKVPTIVNHNHVDVDVPPPEVKVIDKTKHIVKCKAVCSPPKCPPPPKCKPKCPPRPKSKCHPPSTCDSPTCPPSSTMPPSSSTGGHKKGCRLEPPPTSRPSSMPTKPSTPRRKSSQAKPPGKKKPHK